MGRVGRKRKIAATGSGLQKRSKMTQESDRESQRSFLPPELIQLIFNKMATVTDSLRFLAVCKSWRSIDTAMPGPHREADLLPRLMLPYDPKSTTRSFFNLDNRRPLHLDSPQFRGKLIRGSSNGYLILLDPKSAQVSLLNPATGSKINLPPANTFPREFGLNIDQDGTSCTLDRIYLRTASLSSDPKDEDCIIILTFRYSPKFAFCRVKTNSSSYDQQWNIVDTTLPRAVESVVYHEGKFYAVDYIGHGAICIASSPFEATLIPLPIELALCVCDCHMVKTSQGEALLVATCYGVPNLRWESFKVFKMEEIRNGQFRWFETKNIGNNGLLVSGDNQCLCIPATGWVESNCVYFPIHSAGYRFNTHRYSTAIYKSDDADHEILQYEIHTEEVVVAAEVEFKKLSQSCTKKRPQKLRETCWIVPSLF